MAYRTSAYEYEAMELSIPCPWGLSGGPVFDRQRPGEVTAMVTENVETATLVDEETRVTSGGAVEAYLYRRVINYGVALLLHPHIDWIEKNCT
jgi:hypothetical protein